MTNWRDIPDEWRQQIRAWAASMLIVGAGAGFAAGMVYGDDVKHWTYVKIHGEPPRPFWMNEDGTVDYSKYPGIDIHYGDKLREQSLAKQKQQQSGADQKRR